VSQQSKPHTLYMITLAIEFFVSSVARLTLYGLIVLIPVVLLILGLVFIDSSFVHFISRILLLLIWTTGIVVGFGPTVMSIFAYIGYGGGHTLTRYALGAREPSTRERRQIQEALRQIVAAADGISLKGFSAIYVVDSPMEFLYLIGTTLYLSSGSIHGRYFCSMLAHEIGHAQNEDGAIILALRRLVFPVFYVFIANVKDYSTSRQAVRESIVERPEVHIRTPDFGSLESDPAATFFSMTNSLIFFLFSFAGGGLGVWLTSGLWAKYFREREYLADKVVVTCGLHGELLEYLEEKRFYDTSVPYMLNWQPANEQRIDKLQPASKVPA